MTRSTTRTHCQVTFSVLAVAVGAFSLLQTIREIRALGVLDYHPTAFEPATADHVREWVEVFAVDGFGVSIDAYEDAVDPRLR
jgi:hypothetical protein